MTSPIDDFALTMLEGAPKERGICVYDLESKSGDTQAPGFDRPFMATFYDGERFRVFRNAPRLRSHDWQTRHLQPGGCIDKLLCHIFARPTKRYQKSSIYAHNGGSFDHLFLLAWLVRNKDLEFSVTPVSSSIQRIDVWRTGKKKYGKWTFLDSMKLIPMSLAKAAKSFGLEGKEDIDLALHEDDPQWDKYNEVDCLRLYQVMQKAKLLIEGLGGELGMTAPSTAMKLFRRRYMGQGKTPDRVDRHKHFEGCEDEKCHGCCHEFIRRAYYGGRTEIFRMYGRNLHYFDINSSYPASMRQEMPTGNRTVLDRIDDRYHDSHVGFVECTVHIPEGCRIPPLPYRAETGKLIFPVGTFSGTWDLEELDLLRDPYVDGKILNIKKVVYIQKGPLLREMVEDLYTYRDKSKANYDEGLSILSKLLMNSLYGKFGMNEERQEIMLPGIRLEGHCYLCRNEMPPDNKNQICPDCEGSKPANGKPDCAVWYKKNRVSAPYIIPQIAAHITTLSRVLLWKKMREILERGGNIYYVDTDSILTDVEIETGNALGQMKNEYPGETLRGDFLQPKVYVLQKDTNFAGEHVATCKDKKCAGCTNVKIAMKGLPKAQRTLANLDKLRLGETIPFTRLCKVRTLARDGFRDPPRIVGVTKSFAQMRLDDGANIPKYDKRRVLANGHTLPMVLSEDSFESAAE